MDDLDDEVTKTDSGLLVAGRLKQSLAEGYNPV